MKTRVDFFERGFCYHGPKKSVEVPYEKLEHVIEEHNQRRGIIYHMHWADGVVNLPQNYYGHGIYDQIVEFED